MVCGRPGQFELQPAAPVALADALPRLYSLGPGRMLQGRDRLRRLLARAGDPHLAVPSILVGGTNGKGTTVALLSALLSRCLPTGAFIKPHLKSISERWRINDQDVAAEQLAPAIQQACDLIDSHGDPVSFFEANVLIGSLLFAQSGCRIAIWEIGLGGREDACNLADPLLSILVNVGYDHQQVLGATLSEIAGDKAYICRSGRPLLLGAPRPGWSQAYAEYAPVVEQVCSAQGARLTALPRWPRHLKSSFIRQGVLNPSSDGVQLVLAAWRLLAPLLDLPELSEPRLWQGLRAMRYRCRLERTSLGGAPVLLDAAHNVDSLRALARTLRQQYSGERLPLVFGCQVTRDPRELLAELASRIEVLVPVEIPVLRPCPLGHLIDAAQQLGIPVSLPAGLEPSESPLEYAIGDNSELFPPDNSTHWIESVRYALSLADPRRPLVICGSIYCLGEILRAFEPAV